MRSRFRRWLTVWALKLGVGAVFVGADGKWPSQLLLRSPFLKQEALFAGQAVTFRDGFRQPMLGDRIRGACSDASGILVFAPKLTNGQWRKKDGEGGYHAVERERCRLAEGSLILLDVD